MEIIALVISIVSFLAVVYQNHNMKTTLGNQVYNNFLENSLDVDRILIEYPHVRKYIYGNEPVDDSTPDLERIMCVTEYVVECIENIEVYEKYLPKNRRAGWHNFITDTKNSPAYKYYMKRYGSWFEIE